MSSVFKKNDSFQIILMKTADSQIYLWIDGGTQILKILKIAKICVIWAQKNDSLSTNFKEDRRFADLFYGLMVEHRF